MQAWQSSRARYQPNQWSSGASDFHQELQSKFTIDKKHEHCSKLHEQDSHCFDLSDKIPIKSRSTNLPLVPRAECENTFKPWSFLFAPEAAVVWLKNPCNLKPWFKLSTKHKNIKNTATTKPTQTQIAFLSIDNLSGHGPDPHRHPPAPNSFLVELQHQWHRRNSLLLHHPGVLTQAKPSTNVRPN